MVVVVLDEAVPEATDTFVAEQGAGGEAAEDLDNDIIYEVGQCVSLFWGLLHFVCKEITEEENNPTKIQQ